MKHLTLLRHAKSVQDPAYPVDRERPLAPRGREDAPLIGRLLARADLTPQRIVTSPALRARETARLVAQAAEVAGDLAVADLLYPGTVEDLLAVVRALPAAVEHALLVGHNPGLEDLSAFLMGVTPGGAGLRLPTGGIAHFELTVLDWSQAGEGRGMLLWLANPRLLKKPD